MQSKTPSVFPIPVFCFELSQWMEERTEQTPFSIAIVWPWTPTWIQFLSSTRSQENRLLMILVLSEAQTIHGSPVLLVVPEVGSRVAETGRASLYALSMCKTPALDLRATASSVLNGDSTFC